MGPSVKFVSPNKGLISKKKMGVNFLRRENDQTGGGVRGGVGKRPYFSPICFFEPFPNAYFEPVVLPLWFPPLNWHINLNVS